MAAVFGGFRGNRGVARRDESMLQLRPLCRNHYVTKCIDPALTDDAMLYCVVSARAIAHLRFISSVTTGESQRDRGGPKGERFLRNLCNSGLSVSSDGSIDDVVVRADSGDSRSLCPLAKMGNLRVAAGLSYSDGSATIKDRIGREIIGLHSADFAEDVRPLEKGVGGSLVPQANV